MKRFRKEKSSSKVVEPSSSEGTASAPVKSKKKKSFLSIFSRKKKDKSSPKDVVSERSGTELAVEDRNGPPCNSSNQPSLGGTGERSAMTPQETSKLPPGAKSEELAVFEFFTTDSPDGSVSSGFHEAQLSSYQSEPRHRHMADVRLSFPVGSDSKKLCQCCALAIQGSSNEHRCVSSSQSCVAGLKSDSNTLLLHPPVRTVTAHRYNPETVCDRCDSVRRASPVEECNIDLGPAAKLWFGQANPVTFADGTTRIVSWNMIGDKIVGSVVDDRSGGTNSTANDLLIQDHIVCGQSKSDETEAQDSRDVPETIQEEDSQSTRHPGKTSTCNFPQTRESYQLEDISKSAPFEVPERKHTLESNTSSGFTPQKSSKAQNQLTSPEGGSSACSLDSLERVSPQENVSCSHLDDAGEFVMESYIGVQDAAIDSASEEPIKLHHPPDRCDSIQAGLRRRDDSSADGDTSSVFSADAGVTDKFSGIQNEHLKLALHKCNSSDAVLSAKSKTNRAIWFDVTSGRSREITPEVNRSPASASVSSELSRKSLSEVAKPDVGSTTIGASNANCVNAGKTSSSSIKNLNAATSKTGSLSRPAGSSGNARWKSVTDLTRAGSRSTSDANNWPTPSVYDPQVAADLAKRFAAINARFRTMAADAIARRESGSHLFKESEQGRSGRPPIAPRSHQSSLEDGGISSEADLSWKLDGTLTQHFNEPDRVVLEGGRPVVTKDRTESTTADEITEESWESPLVSGTLAMNHTKGVLNCRDKPTEDRKYSSVGDLHCRFPEDDVFFPASDSSISRAPSSAVNHTGRLGGTVRRPVQEAVADETPTVNRPRKKTLHEQMQEVRSQVNQWHKDLTLNNRLRYANVFDNSE